MRFRKRKSDPPKVESYTMPLPDTAAATSDASIEDLGFSSKLNSKVRLINPDGTFNIIREGGGSQGWHIYLMMVQTSWLNFSLSILAFYIISNVFFALLYMLVGIEQLSSIVSPSWLANFANAFFFSVQTFTTVGYGSISPVGIGADLIAALNALFGLMSFAIATGLTFARFSRPTTSILFSKNALIAPYKGGKGFMFRIANLRSTQLVNVQATVSMTWIIEKDGLPTRTYSSLKLERNRVAMFPLNWTIVHPIDDDSPLKNKTWDELQAMDIEFITVIKAFDDTFSQYIQDFGSYKFEETIYGAQFVPMYHVNASGHTVLELDKIHTFNKVKLSD